MENELDNKISILLNKYDSINFCEHFLGIKLFPCQKEFFKKLKKSIKEDYYDVKFCPYQENILSLLPIRNEIYKISDMIKPKIKEKDDKEMNKIRYEFFENLEAYYLVANIAGFNKDDIDVNFKNQNLYIKLKENSNFDKLSDDSLAYKIEKIKEDFDLIDSTDYGLDINDPEIVLTIDEDVDVDSIKATVKNGLLTIMLKKVAQPTKIEIQ